MNKLEQEYMGLIPALTVSRLGLRNQSWTYFANRLQSDSQPPPSSGRFDYPDPSLARPALSSYSQ